MGDVDEQDDKQEALYRSIVKRVTDRWPMAAVGPAHIVFDDGNWGACTWCIGVTCAVIAHRAVREIKDGSLEAEIKFVYRDVVPDFETYADHPMSELGATLDALRLIEWHEGGCVGDTPLGG